MPGWHPETMKMVDTRPPHPDPLPPCDQLPLVATGGEGERRRHLRQLESSEQNGDRRTAGTAEAMG